MYQSAKEKAYRAGRAVAKGALGVTAGVVAVAQNAQAAIALTEVQTAVTGATTSGETVGGYVIAAVAALAVVGVIIALVRKL